MKQQRILIKNVGDGFYSWNRFNIKNIIIFFAPFVDRLGIASDNQKYIILAKTDSHPDYCNIIGAAEGLYINNVRVLKPIITDLLIRLINDYNRKIPQNT